MVQCSRVVTDLEFLCRDCYRRLKWKSEVVGTCFGKTLVELVTIGSKTRILDWGNSVAQGFYKAYQGIYAVE